MKFDFLKTLLTFIFLSGSGFVNAGLITFEGVDGFISGTSQSINVGEFKFDLVPEGQSAFILFSTFDSPCGGDCLFNANGASTVLSRVDGAAFSLSSFDFARRPNDTNGARSAVFLNLIGTTATGQVLGLTANLNDLMQTHTTSLFSNITSLRFSAGAVGANGNSFDREFMLDNISVGSVGVPEPSTLAIFTLGIIGLALHRFKKQF